MNVTDQDLQYFVTTLKNVTKYDFTEYSDKSLKRRLLKVLTDLNLDLVGLITNVKQDTCFAENVVKEITVNTTELFRLGLRITKPSTFGMLVAQQGKRFTQ